MGAIRMRVQTADKYNNPQVIHTTPLHQLMSCKKLHVWKKTNPSLKRLTLNCCHNNPVEKSIPCCPLTSEYTDIFVKNCFGMIFLIKDCLICAYLYSDSHRYIFSWLKVKNIMMDWICFLQICSFLLQKTLIDGLELCRLLVDYCDVFISCLNSHSDGTHSLQKIHWWASDVMVYFSKSVPMKKQSHLHLKCTFLANIHFCVYYSFKWKHEFYLELLCNMLMRCIWTFPDRQCPIWKYCNVQKLV